MSVTELRVVNAMPSEPDMLREANHRISNHLSLLASMVQIQAGGGARGAGPFPRTQVQALLRETAAKIVAVGHLHRRLSQQASRSVVNLCDYLTESCTTLVSSLSLGERVSLVHRLTASCNVTPEQ